MEITVKTLAGLEEVLAEEMRQIGMTDVQTGLRLVTAVGDQRALYRANLSLRTGIRVLTPIAKFMSHDESSLYRMMGKTDWSTYLGSTGNLWIDTVVQSRRFKNSQFVARLAKDAIVDQFREATGERPSVSKDAPDLRLNIHIGKLGHTTVSLDSSGEGLHRRGYRRQSGGPAPLNEVLAAGLLLLAGYDGERPFVDPMCGSGTLACEAAMIAANYAPNKDREFGFQRWPNYDEALWKSVVSEAAAAEKRPEYPIFASDNHPMSVDSTQRALAAIGMENYVTVQQGLVQELAPPPPRTDVQPGGILVTNPPYEFRLQTGDIEKLYGEIGDSLKQHYAGYSAWLFSANRDALKRVGLRTSRKIILMNGPLEARLQRYDMYRGKL